MSVFICTDLDSGEKTGFKSLSAAKAHYMTIYETTNPVWRSNLRRGQWTLHADDGVMLVQIDEISMR